MLRQVRDHVLHLANTTCLGIQAFEAWSVPQAPVVWYRSFLLRWQQGHSLVAHLQKDGTLIFFSAKKRNRYRYSDCFTFHPPGGWRPSLRRASSAWARLG